MTYEQAMALAKAGTRVKRTGWDRQYITKREGTEELHIDVHITRETIAPYTSTNEDIVSDDWTTA